MSLENKTLIKLINFIPYGIVISDSSRDLLYSNVVAKEFFGEKLQSTITSKWSKDLTLYSLNRETRISEDQAPISRSLSGEIVKNEKYFVKDVSGLEFFIKVSCYPIYNNKGDIECTMLIFDDITKDELNIENIMGKIIVLEKYLKDTLNIDYESIKIKENGKEAQF